MDEAKVQEYNYRVQRGLPFRRIVEFTADDGTPYSLVDHTVQCRVRKGPRGVGEVIFENIAAIESPASAGIVSLSLTTEQALQHGGLPYTLYLTYPNTEKRAMLKGELLFEDVD
jgi:hypothetical protein